MILFSYLIFVVFFGISQYFLVFRSIAGCRRSDVQLLVSSVFAPAEHDFIFSFDFRSIFWYFLVFLSIS
jgi:hypothetical protein